ncbi:MAG: hypothetical protein NVSMB16_02820 [Acidimicrobiales bacterium]
MPEPLPKEHLAVLAAVKEAGRTGGNPTKLARASVAHLNDDDYEDLVLELIDKEMIMGSKTSRGSSAARYPTGITQKGRDLLSPPDAAPPAAEADASGAGTEAP